MSLNLKKSKTEHKQLKNEWEVKQTPSRNYFNYSWYPKKKKIESWTKEFESLIEEIAFCQNCRITSSLFSIIGGIQCIFLKKKNNFMVAFYELGSAVLSLQSNCEETVPFYH